MVMWTYGHEKLVQKGIRLTRVHDPFYFTEIVCQYQLQQLWVLVTCHYILSKISELPKYQNGHEKLVHKGDWDRRAGKRCERSAIKCGGGSRKRASGLRTSAGTARNKGVSGLRSSVGAAREKRCERSVIGHSGGSKDKKRAVYNQV